MVSGRKVWIRLERETGKLKNLQEDQRERKHPLAEENTPEGVKCRNAAIPRSSLNFESVDTKVKLGHAAHNVLSKIVRTKRSAPSWKGTPVMISGFSVLQKEFLTMLKCRSSGKSPGHDELTECGIHLLRVCFQETQVRAVGSKRLAEQWN
eukprot:1161606-Pelagomonas_calceolata.AAC.2